MLAAIIIFDNAMIRFLLVTMCLMLPSSVLMAQEDAVQSRPKSEFYENLWWEYYDSGSLGVFLSHSQIRQYGRYHKIEVYLENRGDSAITVCPERDFVATTARHADGGRVKARVFGFREMRRRTSSRQFLSGMGLGMVALADMALCDHPVVDAAHYLLDHGPLVDDAINYACASISQSRILRQEYLRTTTLMPGECCSGFVLIEKVPGHNVLFLSLICGNNEYRFAWKGRMHEQGEMMME